MRDDKETRASVSQTFFGSNPASAILQLGHFGFVRSPSFLSLDCFILQFEAESGLSVRSKDLSYLASLNPESSLLVLNSCSSGSRLPSAHKWVRREIQGLESGEFDNSSPSPRCFRSRLFSLSLSVIISLSLSRSLPLVLPLSLFNPARVVS